MARRYLWGLLITTAGFILAACGQPGQSSPAVEVTTTAVNTRAVTADQGEPADEDLFYLWAEDAEASSEFASPEWGAEKALGEPDAPGCGDYQYAWASAASDSVETLTVEFGYSLYPREIRVVESFNPDQVVRVEIYNPGTQEFITVLEKEPEQVDRPCPYTLRVPVEGVDFRTNRVRITIDQSVLGLGWNEIDAVELIGTISPE